jgi:hypothetical protein
VVVDVGIEVTVQVSGQVMLATITCERLQSRQALCHSACESSSHFHSSLHFTSRWGQFDVSRC